MASKPNKQPLFPFTPILEYLQFDPKIPTSMASFDNGDVIFTDNSDWGCLITRIRVISSALTDDSITRKTIYLGLNTGGKDTVLYKTGTFENYTLGPLDTLPFVEFTFGNGLATNPGDKIIIAASENAYNSGFDGDQIQVIVEGGIYDKIPI